jgi:hypothetical protein
VLPLWLDAAIPGLFPLLETLSEIFHGNAVKGRQHPSPGEYYEGDYSFILVWKF